MAFVLRNFFQRTFVFRNYLGTKKCAEFLKYETKVAIVPHRKLIQTTVSSAKIKHDAEYVTINFVDRDGDCVKAKAKVGDNLLDVAVENDIDLEGACEGTLSCSTCHLIFSEENYACLPESVTDEEMDMLDLAYGLTDTSRLGCQVYVNKEMNDWTVQVPDATADARDG